MAISARPAVTPGKILVSLVGSSAAVGAFAADWNETHIYNPNWPPHAKFHNAQTMVFAVDLAAISLYQLWVRKPYTRSSLRWATLFAGLFWGAQAPAILFPGTAFTDPEQAGSQPKVLGVTINQVVGQVVLIYPLLGLGYYLESRRLRRSEARSDRST
jgi:hypothetical protein